MKQFFSHLRGAAMATVMLALVCCGVYPLVVFGIGQAVFRDRANGSLIAGQDGTVRGSRLLAQGFTGDQYFHPRPSSAGAHGYDAASSSGSNLGPTSRKLSDAIKERIAAYRRLNGLQENERVPADAVTASGSGLDPHIGARNAGLQSQRVARARKLALEKVAELVHRHTDSRSFGVLGEPGVNVLTLNLALDALPPNP